MRLHEAARTFIDVPFKHQGRNPEFGIDCIGLVKLSLALLGVVTPDRRNYPRDPDGTLNDAMRSVFGPEAFGLRADDAVSIRYKGQARHVAIVGENRNGLTLIHTDARIGRVVEQPLDDRWRKRIVASWRLPA